MAEQPSPTEKEQMVEEIAARYLDLLEQGEAPDPRALAGEYPGIVDRLEQRLAEVARSFEERQRTTAAPRPADAAVDTDPRRHPERVGPYKILEVLGESDGDVLYLAQETDPRKRKVALRVLTIGADTRVLMARLDSERQALASIDHTCIAGILDIGKTDTGQTYVVTEYVPGPPITEYCSVERHSTTERLQIFLRLCEAVHRVHQRGIIHGALKPSNVVIGPGDGGTAPTIVGFGGAGPTRARPGQGPVALDAPGMDTRTDIYDLGAILYELLAGASPVSDDRLVPPSMRAAESRRDGPDGAPQRRRSDPPSRAVSIRGDLDWITMKALDADPDLRYAT
ncbi:MAG: protein kinase, partial [Planctomycetota bacterium]|nr:protein kinase [Planctomycetota bacterium]